MKLSSDPSCHLESILFQSCCRSPECRPSVGGGDAGRVRLPPCTEEIRGECGCTVLALCPTMLPYQLLDAREIIPVSWRQPPSNAYFDDDVFFFTRNNSILALLYYSDSELSRASINCARSSAGPQRRDQSTQAHSKEIEDILTLLARVVWTEPLSRISAHIIDSTEYSVSSP